MTQTIPTAAMVKSTFGPGLTFLTVIPMTSVELAREEFGPTLADAKAFALTTCCTECGMDAEAALMLIDRQCQGCATRGCDCVLSGDPHTSDVFWCSGCAQVCGGYCCD